MLCAAFADTDHICTHVHTQLVKADVVLLGTLTAVLHVCAHARVFC